MTENRNGFAERNTAIDILRALTMFLMIFVNDLWTINAYPEWLGHAEYDQDMLGLSDIVFPAFLIVVGMSIPYAIERRFAKGLSGVSTVAHILTRTLALLIMGVFLVNTEFEVVNGVGIPRPVYMILIVTAFFLIWNVYPRSDKKARNYLFTGLKILGILMLIGLAVIYTNPSSGVFQARWWGILGLIGWTYLVCAFVYLFSRDRLKYLISVWLFLIILCILKTTTINGNRILDLPPGNFFDQMLDILHIGNGALPAFTMSGVLLSVLGIKLGNLSNNRKVLLITACILLFVLAGFITHNYWIISKLQQTPPWVFYCIAGTMATYLLVSWLVYKGKARWFDIIKPAGTATLTCYLVPYVVVVMLPAHLVTGIWGVLKCVLFSFLVIGITYLLNRIHIKLKI